MDVTDDEAVDALAIPDLFGVKHQSHMNTSGAIEILNPATLAVRFETQYIVGHSLEARPDRRLTWALAAFVMGLVTFGLGLLNVPGIVMSIVIGALLISVIALPKLWEKMRG